MIGLLVTAIGCSGDAPDGDKNNGGGTTDPGDDTGGPGTTDEPDDPLKVDDDGDGFSEYRGDCDDTNPDVYPRAIERCNGIDDDCDTKVDDDDIDVYGQASWWVDGDGDGFGSDLEEVYACEDPTAMPTTPRLRRRRRTEPRTVWYIDADFDGYGSDAVTRTACEQPGGYAAAADDCNDSDDSINPAADEICDELDNDCDGDIDDDDSSIVDEENGVVFYEDADGDGYGVLSETTALGCAVAPSGFADNTDDCDDTDGSISPGATRSGTTVSTRTVPTTTTSLLMHDGYDGIDHSGTDCDDLGPQVNPGRWPRCATTASTTTARAMRPGVPTSSMTARWAATSRATRRARASARV